MINMSLDAKLYRGAAGAKAAIEVTTCKDVSFKMKKGEAKISKRSSRWALGERLAQGGGVRRGVQLRRRMTRTCRPSSRPL